MKAMLFVVIVLLYQSCSNKIERFDQERENNERVKNVELSD